MPARPWLYQTPRQILPKASNRASPLRHTTRATPPTTARPTRPPPAATELSATRKTSKTTRKYKESKYHKNITEHPCNTAPKSLPKCYNRANKPTKERNHPRHDFP